MTKMTKSKYEISWTAVAMILIVLPKAEAQPEPQPGTVVMKMVLTAQGKDRCPDETNNDGPKVVLKARSRLDCARMCTSREGCLSQSFNKKDKTCIHYYSTPAKLVPAEDCNFMVNPEAFEGCNAKALVKADPNSCSLPFQYGNREYDRCITDIPNSTPHCLTPSGQMADCIAPPGFYVKQSLLVLPAGVSGPVPCISNWIILMQRWIGGDADFVGNWTEYKNGFGDFAGPNFWIGNERMYAITNEPGMAYMLRVEVQTYTKGLWYYAEYASFRIDSEANKYALHVSGYSGDAGDSLSNVTDGPKLIHNGMSFSTLDADNDKKVMNPSCAAVKKGSWWFNNCYMSCLTCDAPLQYFSWFSLHNYGLQSGGALRAARMMIRSI